MPYPIITIPSRTFPRKPSTPTLGWWVVCGGRSLLTFTVSGQERAIVAGKSAHISPLTVYIQRPASELGLGFPQVESSGNLVASGKGSKEATIMPHHWPSEPPLVRWELDVLDRGCRVCGRKMHVCDHRRHPIYTLQGPRLLVNRLVHCVDPDCTGHHRTVSPEAEAAIALPRSIIGWDLFCWIGHRRFARHWSVPQIRAELLDSRQIGLSDDAIEDALRHYQRMLAARQQDPRVLADEYAAVNELRLSIDGLQPEKGHETLYVVRELTLKRVWFAEALVSSSAAPYASSDSKSCATASLAESTPPRGIRTP